MSFLKFEEKRNEGKKTRKFLVLNTSGELLGWIQWKGGWRKYVFLTVQAEYDTKCLLEIIGFINDLMEERKKKKINFRI